MNVSIDSNIFIWGIKKEATTGQDSMIERTEVFLKQLSDSGSTIIIPTLVLSECLAILPVIERNVLISEIQGFIHIAPFDAKASAILSELLHEFYTSDELKEFSKSNQIPRNRIKADYIIAATSIAAGASVIYSHDPVFTKFVGGRIKVSEIPPLVNQLKIGLEY